MIEILDCEQRSPEWYEARRGIPTASNFGKIMAKGEGKMRRSYLLQLAAEILTGELLETYSNADMERGREHEAAAARLYAYANDCEIRHAGFIRWIGPGNGGWVGYSPDGLIGDDGLVEIKSKRGDLLIGTILNGKFPGEHYWQCLGGMLVAEREWIDLVCYWPGIPLFTKTLQRSDPQVADDMRLLREEIERFNEELQHTVDKVKRYGAAP